MLAWKGGMTLGHRNDGGYQCTHVQLADPLSRAIIGGAHTLSTHTNGARPTTCVASKEMTRTTSVGLAHTLLQLGGRAGLGVDAAAAQANNSVSL